MSLVHILPEAAAEYVDLMTEEEREYIFPLPYFLAFCGYSLILIIDKVMFDSHALLEGGEGHGHGHGHGGHGEEKESEDEHGHSHGDDKGHSHSSKPP